MALYIFFLLQSVLFHLLQKEPDPSVAKNVESVTDEKTECAVPPNSNPAAGDDSPPEKGEKINEFETGSVFGCYSCCFTFWFH